MSFIVYLFESNLKIAKNQNEKKKQNKTKEEKRKYAKIQYVKCCAPTSLIITFFYYCCYMYNIGSWSASTSPARSPSPSRYGGHLSRSKRTQLPYPTYGTTSLCQRSRSPSPARLQEMRERDRLGYGIDMGTSLALVI